MAPRGKVVVPIALLVCCALAIALYASFPAHSRPAASALAPAVALAVPPSATTDRPVHLRLSAQPPSARFTIDGAPVATNPYEADVPADHAMHAIAALAEGFAPREIDEHFDRDVSLDVTLAASASTPATPAPTHPSLPAAGPAPRRAPAPPSPKAQRAIEEEDPYKK